MDGKKISFVLLGAIAIVFAVVVVLGARNRGPAGQPSWATTAHDWFVQDEPLKPGEVKGDCVTGGTAVQLLPGRSCAVTIARRDGVLVRNMTLELSDGLKVKGKLTPRGDDAGPVSITLQTAVSKLKLPIIEDGARLDLQCVMPNPVTLGCRVAVR
jgi:hypothetical protein